MDASCDGNVNKLFVDKLTDELNPDNVKGLQRATQNVYILVLK